MKPVTGYHLIGPDDLQWRPANLMKIPNAGFLERMGERESERAAVADAAGEREYTAQTCRLRERHLSLQRMQPRPAGIRLGSG